MESVTSRLAQLKSKGALVVAFAAVGVAGLCIGRWSGRVPEVEAKVAAPASPASSSSAPGDRSPPQQFDTREDPTFTAGVPLRPMDREIFGALADANLDRKALPDLFPDRPYRVRVVGSVAERRFGSVLIDMNRDGKVDEHWTLKGNHALRAVAEDPTAGGTEIQYTLAHGRWQVH